MSPVEVPEVRYVHGPGGSIAYQVWGEGDGDLLFLSEWGTSVDNLWEHPGRFRFLGFLGSLGRVVRFDPRDQGASDPLPVQDCGRVDLWAADALAVLDHVAMQRVVAVGEGYGSQVALHLAAEHAGRVERMVLLNAFARLVQGDGYPHGPTREEAERLIAPVGRRWGRGVVTTASVPSLLVGSPDPGFPARSERVAASPGVAAAISAAMFASDVRHLLPRIGTPTLVVQSGEFLHVDREHSEFVADHLPDARMVEAPSQTLYWNETGFGEMAEFVTGERTGAGDRELCSVLFTDIVGSTERAVASGDTSWRRTLDDFDAFVGAEIARHGGTIVKQTGDGHLATFTTPAKAIRAGTALLRAAHSFDLGLRAGVHTGEVERRAGGDIGGIGVHIASRIASLAGQDELLVSRTVADLVAGGGFVLEDRGEHHLRGVPAPWRLFAVGH